MTKSAAKSKNPAAKTKPSAKAKPAQYNQDLEQLLNELQLDSDTEASTESFEPKLKMPEVLPAHACVYCTVHNPMCVAKCNTCFKWFCNSRKYSESSHIVNHLAKSGHKQVSLHPASLFGDTVLECFNCGCKNIFLLGFVQSKDSTAICCVVSRAP